MTAEIHCTGKNNTFLNNLAQRTSSQENEALKDLKDILGDKTTVMVTNREYKENPIVRIYTVSINDATINVNLTTRYFSTKNSQGDYATLTADGDRSDRWIVNYRDPKSEILKSSASVSYQQGKEPKISETSPSFDALSQVLLDIKNVAGKKDNFCPVK